MNVSDFGDARQKCFDINLIYCCDTTWLSHGFYLNDHRLIPLSIMLERDTMSNILWYHMDFTYTSQSVCYSIQLTYLLVIRATSGVLSSEMTAWMKTHNILYCDFTWTSQSVCCRISNLPISNQSHIGSTIIRNDCMDEIDIWFIEFTTPDAV